MVYDSTFSTETQVLVLSQQNSERAEILALADHALQEYRTAWAKFVTTGSDEAFRLAMAAREDREQLLKQVSHD